MCGIDADENIEVSLFVITIYKSCYNNNKSYRAKGPFKHAVDYMIGGKPLTTGEKQSEKEIRNQNKEKQKKTFFHFSHPISSVLPSPSAAV